MRLQSATLWHLATVCPLTALPAQGLDVVDTFGRSALSPGLVVVDWEGHIANPLVRIQVVPPATATFPATATVTADHQRLYFNRPSTVGANGPGKTLSFSDATPRSLQIAIFPDRDAVDENYNLHVDFRDATGAAAMADVTLHVLDQDLARGHEVDVTFDYSEDKSGFFGTTERGITETAVREWTYFLADPGLDPVAVGAERHFVWNWPLAWTGGGTTTVWNSVPYTGFHLWVYGIATPQLRSGGEPSNCCLQSVNGAPLSIRRSGGVEIETQGNYNRLGWFRTASADDWWVSGNLGNEPNDLFSIAHHEFGHALGFDARYPLFGAAKTSGSLSSPAIVAYYGGAVRIDASSHFAGAVDPASGRGVFGNEYRGRVPARRWLPTKLDLLMLEAVGHTLRPTTPLAPLVGTAAALPQGAVGIAYRSTVQATGGVPAYDFTIDTGALPPGLTLDRFAGIIGGTPTAAGSFAFSVRIADSGTEPDQLVSGRIDVITPQCQAAWTTYGAGTPGTLGIPTVNLVGLPQLGQPVTLQYGNSAGTTTQGALLLGTQRTTTALLGGTLLVPPLTTLPIPVPVPGGGVVLTVPGDPMFDCSRVMLQVVELDPGATQGVSFSRGVELTLGQ